METLAYWLSRLEPIIRAETEGEIIVVLANRCGAEGDALYAGTSAVLGINEGEVKVYGILGRGEKELLVVDTSKAAQAKLISEPNSAASAVTNGTDFTATSATTAATSPIVDDFPLNSDEFPSPVSPRNPNFHQAYFGSKQLSPERDPLRNSLKSSIGQPTFKSPSPLSPTFQRPESPKSRNASRNEEREESEPPLSAHDLSQEAKDSLPPLKTPPHSASADPVHFESTSSRNSLGPRSRHVSPRPKSAMW